MTDLTTTRSDGPARRARPSRPVGTGREDPAPPVLSGWWLLPFAVTGAGLWALILRAVL